MNYLFCISHGNIPSIHIELHCRLFSLCFCQSPMLHMKYKTLECFETDTVYC